MVEHNQQNIHIIQNTADVASKPKKNILNHNGTIKEENEQIYSDSKHTEGFDFDSFNLLVIGCGGIGCELLKLFLLSRLKYFTIVDMDNIELTNLNRQFFFQKKDIGKNKAIVTKKFYQEIIKESQVTVYDKNIMSKQFDVEFFKRYDLVLNCLDNIEARAFVNLRCKLAGVSIMDGGSGGYFGQSMVFLHNKIDNAIHYMEYINKRSNSIAEYSYTSQKDSILEESNLECYSCSPKIQSENVPICTIRGTPTNFTHCLLFAKEMIFNELSENSWFRSKRKIAKFLSRHWDKKSQKDNPEEQKPNHGHNHGADQKITFQKNKKIVKQSALKKNITNNQKNKKSSKLPEKKMKIKKNLVDEDKKKHEIDKIYHLSQKSDQITKKIKKYYQLLKRQNFPIFDKENGTVVKFIYYVGCFRAWQFDIEILSFLEAEKIISRIVPAICTTNSIVASLMFHTMRKILYNRVFMDHRKENAKNLANMIQINKKKDTDEEFPVKSIHLGDLIRKNVKPDEKIKDISIIQEKCHSFHLICDKHCFYNKIKNSIAHPLNYFLTKAKKLISPQYQAISASDCTVCASKWFLLNLVDQIVQKELVLEELGIVKGDFFIDDQLQLDNIFKIDHNKVLILVDKMEVFRFYVQCNMGYFNIINI